MRHSLRYVTAAALVAAAAFGHAQPAPSAASAPASAATSRGAQLLGKLRPEVKAYSAAEIDAAMAGSPLTDCFWVATISPKTINILFPDDGVTYWTAQYRLPVGARLGLEGSFPHARYMSLSTYDAQGTPLDRIADAMIEPERGATNPFRDGARRDAVRRGWHVDIEPRALVAGRPGADAAREKNTVYVPEGEALTQLWYRVYVPDRGRDAKGGVPLPRPVLTLADGHRFTGEALCRAIVVKDGAVRDLHLPAATLQPLYSLAGSAPFHPAQAEPRWVAFFNPLLSIANLLIGTPDEALRGKLDTTRRGGFYGTLDNTYMSMYVDARYGDVLVLHGRAPTTPHTYGGEATMHDGDLRYWSLCKNRSLADTAVDACIYDEQIPVATDGSVTIVVSKSDKRPSNARAECGIAWLPWGSGDGMKNPDGGFLILRHMLPSAAFRPHSIFATTRPGDERATLGDYYPEAAYMDKAKFEQRGCTR